MTSFMYIRRGMLIFFTPCPPPCRLGSRELGQVTSKDSTSDNQPQPPVPHKTLVRDNFLGFYSELLKKMPSVKKEIQEVKKMTYSYLLL